MQKTIDTLVKNAHEYMQFMATFRVGQFKRNQNLIRNCMKYGYDFYPELRRDLAAMDSDTDEVPIAIAGRLLDGLSYGHQEIQEMLVRVKEFTRYEPDTFAK